MTTKVIKVDSETIFFDNGSTLTSYHPGESCEHHWLGLGDLKLEDFEDLEFNLDAEEEDLFERIDGYGIALKPINNFPVRIPGYGSNNGCYSSQLDLVITNKDGVERTFDISECQDIND